MEKKKNMEKPPENDDNMEKPWKKTWENEDDFAKRWKSRMPTQDFENDFDPRPG